MTGTGIKRQLELKLENGHLRGHFFYKDWKQFVRDCLIVASIIGYGHNTLTLNDVKTQLAQCQSELRNEKQPIGLEGILPIQPGESFFDYTNRVARVKSLLDQNTSKVLGR